MHQYGLAADWLVSSLAEENLTMNSVLHQNFFACGDKENKQHPRVHCWQVEGGDSSFLYSTNNAVSVVQCTVLGFPV